MCFEFGSSFWSGRLSFEFGSSFFLCMLLLQARLAAVVRRTQLPLVHAWALTINRSQGQTLDRILLDLRHAPFSHGQAYVAISRVHVAPDCGVFVNDRCCIEQQGACTRACKMIVCYSKRSREKNAPTRALGWQGSRLAVNECFQTPWYIRIETHSRQPLCVVL